MKKILILTFIMLTLLKYNGKAQTYGVPDTLVYLQNIVANKAFYIGKPFSILLDSMKIQIKCFSPFASIPHDKNKETSTSYGFYFPLNENYMFLTYPRIRIFWEIPLNASQSQALYSTRLGWSQPIIAFYSSAVIKNIDILQ